MKIVITTILKCFAVLAIIFVGIILLVVAAYNIVCILEEIAYDLEEDRYSKMHPAKPVNPYDENFGIDPDYDEAFRHDE